jgi:hypothetical protein
VVADSFAGDSFAGDLSATVFFPAALYRLCVVIFDMGIFSVVSLLLLCCCFSVRLLFPLI